MHDRAIVSISQQVDVSAFICHEVGSGRAIGAIYDQPPNNETALDGFLLALARHVQQRELPESALAPRDRWTEAAANLLAAGLPPLPEGFGSETTVNRLIRWVDPRCRRVVIGVATPLDSAGLPPMQHLAGWMAGASGCDALLVHGTDQASALTSGALRSDAEKSLAQGMDRDAELHGLFQTNARVITVFTERPRVDFVWVGGRLIVEVDSYHYHSSREQFAMDRQRDYITGVSGYQTLRLTTQEVLDDFELALAKVRRFVRLKKGLIYV